MLSVVLPAHNEEANLGPLLDGGLAALGDLADPLEFVVVDDGSTDGTWSLLAARASADERVRPVQHVRQQGYGAAVRTGLRAARHDLVLLCDADRQFDLADAPALLSLAGRGDVVAGYRAQRRDPGLRRLAGAAWTELVNRLYGIGVRDVNCAFKLFHRRVLQDVEILSDGALVNAEILAQVRGAGGRIVEVPVSHQRRRAGQQSGGSPAVVAFAVWELAKNHRRMRRFARGFVD